MVDVLLFPRRLTTVKILSDPVELLICKYAGSLEPTKERSSSLDSAVSGTRRWRDPADHVFTGVATPHKKSRIMYFTFSYIPDDAAIRRHRLKGELPTSIIGITTQTGYFSCKEVYILQTAVQAKTSRCSVCSTTYRR